MLDYTFKVADVPRLSTTTLFEWYSEEMRQRTSLESHGDPLVRAVEMEIEKRLRELDAPKEKPKPKKRRPRRRASRV